METLNIQSHLKTTNIYVRRQIVRQNIEILKNTIYLAKEQKIDYLQKKELQKQLDAQIVLINKINNEIKKKEQCSLSFLPFTSQNL